MGQQKPLQLAAGQPAGGVLQRGVESIGGPVQSLVQADVGQRAPHHGLARIGQCPAEAIANARVRSEEHTSELQSLMRSSYAVFCLTKTTKTRNINVSSVRI